MKFKQKIQKKKALSPLHLIPLSKGQYYLWFFKIYMHSIYLYMILIYVRDVRWKANRIYTREMNAYVIIKIYTNDHSRFICNSQKLWHPKCPSIGEWINKLQCILAMDTTQQQKQMNCWYCNNTYESHNSYA